MVFDSRQAARRQRGHNSLVAWHNSQAGGRGLEAVQNQRRCFPPQAQRPPKLGKAEFAKVAGEAGKAQDTTLKEGVIVAMDSLPPHRGR